MDGTKRNQAVAPPPKLLLWREDPPIQSLSRSTSITDDHQKYQLKKPENLVISPPRRFFCAKTIPSSTVSPYPVDQFTPSPAAKSVPQMSDSMVLEKDSDGKQLYIPSFPTDVMSQYVPHRDIQPQSARSTESIMNRSFRQLIRLSRATAWLIPKAIAATTCPVRSATTPTITEPLQNPFSLAGYSNTSDLIPLRLPSFDEFSKGSDMDQLSSFREELIAHTDKQKHSFGKHTDSYKRNLRFNVHQITSLTSARELEYELLVKVNQETVAIRYGHLKKLAKGISSCSLPEDWLSLKVDGPFELSIALNTKPTRHSKVADYLARRGLWPLWSRKQQQPQPDPASSTQLSCWSSSSDTSSSAVALSSVPSFTTTAPSIGMIPSGHLDLSSGDDLTLIEDGQHHYRLLKPQDSSKKRNYTASLNIELLVEFIWQAQRPSDRVVSPSIQDTAVSSASSNKNDPTFAYPWLRYPGSSALSPVSLESEDHLLADKDAIHVSMSHATKGDYLTFYLYELASPKWERYWVSLKNKRLQIISTMHKNKEPIYNLALESLVQVSKPTEEDQEHVCLNRQVGIVLQLEADNADNDTPLGHRIYVLADTPALALHWIRALTVIKTNNQLQKSNSL